MRKSEVYARIISAVSMETEIPIEIIEGRGRPAEVVDARCILAKLLSESGLNAREIAFFMNMTARNVRRLLKLYDCRIYQHGNMIGRNSEAIRKQLGW